MSSAKSSVLPASHHRFVVQSAEEAVRLIRQKLGDRAHVVSVNQLSGKGLARFLKAPKLEVIATLSPLEDPLLQAKSFKPFSDQEAASFTTPKVAPSPSLPTMPRGENCIKENRIYKHYQRFEGSAQDLGLNSFFEKAGFSDRMVHHLQGKKMGEKASFAHKPSHPLREMVEFLIQQYQGLKRLPFGKRIAFLGSAGAGKSTLLCKQLARDVFIHQASPSVLKLDYALPHSNEALSIFCKALGVPCFKASSLKKLEPSSPIYLDMSGPSLKDKPTWGLLGQKLKDLDVESKVWVIHAAYEEELILENLHLAQELGATHLAFTHLDEVYRLNKLWDSLLLSGLSPALFSYGQSVSGEVTPDILQFLLAKAFPDQVLEELTSYSEGGAP